MPDKSIIEQVMNDPQPIPRKVPDYMRKRGGLWYWTGAMIMIAFFYEAITGLILFIYYQPSNAYVSTEGVLNIAYGSVILTTHLYGAYIMIALVYIHLLRNLFVGAYKKPREIQWLSGVILLILTVAVAYFGYSLTVMCYQQMPPMLQEVLQVDFL
jgi:Cytochrome b subunit of the bc complex